MKIKPQNQTRCGVITPDDGKISDTRIQWTDGSLEFKTNFEASSQSALYNVKKRAEGDHKAQLDILHNLINS